MRWVRRHLFLLLALSLASAASARWFWNQRLGLLVPGLSPSRRAILQTEVVSGLVKPPAVVSLGSEMLGLASEVLVLEGERVEKGQLLLRLRDTELVAGADAARADLDQAQAGLDQLQGFQSTEAEEALQQARVEKELAERTYARQVQFSKTGAAKTVELEEAKKSLQVAVSRYGVAESRVRGLASGGARRLAVAALAGAKARLAQAEARLELSRITAPCAGLILERLVEPGSIVQPGSVVFLLAREGEALLEIEPDERTLARVELGQKALASADAFPERSFEAFVSKIAPAVDSQRGTISIELRVPQAPAELRPGMTVSVQLLLGQLQDALTLPVDAVRDLATRKPWTLVIRNGLLERRNLKIGVQGEGVVEILGGLQDEDRVLAPSAGNLIPGQKVRLLEP